MKIPRDWSQVTIEQYVLLQKTVTDKLLTQVERDELRITRAIILTGGDDIEETTTMEELMWVDKLINTPMSTKISPRIRLNGNLYRVILNPTKELASRFKMAMNAAKDGDENLHRLMFAICVPIKGIFRSREIQLDGAETQKRVEDFKQLPVSIAYPISLFFCNLSKELSKNTHQYLDEMVTTMTTTLNQTQQSLKDMAGLP